ncbi:MAG: ARMT1-like domain-containing protein [Clostridia bacterium]
MKSRTDCVYCYLKQAINCMEHAGVPEQDQYPVLYSLMDVIRELDTGRSPCHNSTLTIRRTYEMIGCRDPFEDEKACSNRLALELLPLAEEYITRNPDPLYAAFKVASAGNIIDMGIMKGYDIEHTLRETLCKDFSVDHYGLFMEKLKDADTVLYLGDNSGEIVFDTLAVRELKKMGKQVWYAVKSVPILNDAMMEDALSVGMDAHARVIETGSAFMGVNTADSSREFLELFNGCDIILSKGQANFESLDDDATCIDRTFFIMKIKCDKVMETIPGSGFGDSVFYHCGG